MVNVMRNVPPIEETIAPNGPIAKLCKTPPIKFVKHQNYGLKKLFSRLKS